MTPTAPPQPTEAVTAVGLGGAGPVVGTATALVVERLRARPAPSVGEALELAVELGRHGALPGLGSTADLWQALATLAAHDVGAARAAEPHLDALAILDQHAEELAANSSETLPDEDGADRSALPARARSDRSFTWGVFAAEGPGVRLSGARRPDAANSWSLSGTKPWCSLAGTVDGALVTAWVGDERRLFSVDLRQDGVAVTADAWHARGLVEIPSGPVEFDEVEAHEVGAPGWYLERPGFSWGGIGVAACWYGGAVGVARTLLAAAVTASSRAPERPADPHLLQALGLVDTRLADARRALVEAADLVDAGEATGEAGRLLAKRVRGTVAHACDEVVARASRALGPAPLATDPEHAKRVADLGLYLRQHHGERDDASLGQTLLRDAVAEGRPAW
ncbi:acyl-CoA dehydrogenase family protein [Frigoribacterium sp. PhB24]|uniref:acyl-CoA dehydrogenase family protein n=1 Tax=Frigoribacterium sp. PhB24 TaxID=2485204 RepID=UPI000F472674|nr:acyl-CoA dehydrogenase family protein [Frigoribacterium sp. PhB24]ROS48962.1 alkylation response protein AidB-like acyl-CoA dehydrogenase [Frigoribacterium sp. PhB24]